MKIFINKSALAYLPLTSKDLVWDGSISLFVILLLSLAIAPIKTTSFIFYFVLFTSSLHLHIIDVFVVIKTMSFPCNLNIFTPRDILINREFLFQFYIFFYFTGFDDSISWSAEEQLSGFIYIYNWIGFARKRKEFLRDCIYLMTNYAELKSSWFFSSSKRLMKHPCYKILVTFLHYFHRTSFPINSGWHFYHDLEWH